MWAGPPKAKLTQRVMGHTISLVLLASRGTTDHAVVSPLGPQSLLSEPQKHILKQNQNTDCNITVICRFFYLVTVKKYLRFPFFFTTLFADGKFSA